MARSAWEAPRDPMDAIVVGAGVIGLSTAIRLLEGGHRVTLVAKARTPATTSDVAAALFFPFRAEPVRRVLPWARRSLAVFHRLASDGAAGVAMVDILHVARDEVQEPWWAGLAPYRRASRHELPEGAHAGFVLRAPVVEMPRYMPWLEARVQALGGRFEDASLERLDELAARDADVVVNCTGLGAGELVDDPHVRPVRGQLVRLHAPPLARAVLEFGDQPTYVIPRSDGIVVGGTADEGRWDLTPEPEAEAAFLARARRLEPRLEGCSVAARSVGLRPGRSEVRLEPELRRGMRVVHNYGHGGCGVTLSWGCAEAAVGLAEAAAMSRVPPLAP